MTVEIDGANNIIKTNTINEVSSANGVTVDGLSIKDSKLVTANSVITTNITDANITQAKTNFVSTSSASGLEIKGDGTTDGTLQLNCSQNSHGIKLKSPPHSAGASYTLTFPNNDGDANQFLQSNGSGVLTWAAAGGGKVLQVLHKKLTSNYSMSSGTTTDVTGLSQAITMASSSNHLLVLGNYCFRIAGNGATVTPSSNTFITNSSNGLLAGSYFLLYLSNNNHNPTWTANQCAYFTPGTTDAYTVKVRTNNASEGGLVQFYGSSNNSYSTNLTLIEIAA